MKKPTRMHHDGGEGKVVTHSPWLKVVFTALVGAAGILSSGVGHELIELYPLLYGLAGPPLGLLVFALSLCVTAASPFKALNASAKLLVRWSSLPSQGEPLLWMLLVVLTEEGIFRLAAFAFLPPSWWSIGLVSLAFTSIHLPKILRRRRQLRVASANMILSLVLCVAYLWSGSFWLVVVAHLVHNLILDKLRGTLAISGRPPDPQMVDGGTG